MKGHHAVMLAVALACFAYGATAAAVIVDVGNATELQDAIGSASPGDEITLAPGTYQLPSKVNCGANGTAAQPIVVRAGTLGDAKIEFNGSAVEGFNVSGARWIFENLEIEGTCGNDSDCEHAWHVVGDAEFTVVRNNRVYNFNAHIKANGQGTPRVFPDDVLVELNEFYNEAIRNTGNPVTPLDIVGGKRWLVRSNYIHDHAKGQGNGISYAAFFKGNSSDGVFERNLVVCEWLHAGQTRLGLSFGGGGSSPDNICEQGTCTPEHRNGIMRNNVIAHCPADVGIYVNEGENSRLFNNTLYDTSGIDFRFGATTGAARNNVLNGQIRDRDGASTMGSNNLILGLGALASLFTDPSNLDFTLAGSGAQIVDQGMNLPAVTDDFCGNDRDDGSNDVGAVEHDGDGPCDTTAPSGGTGGTGGAGAGGSGTGGASGGGAGPGGTAGSGVGGSGGSGAGGAGAAAGTSTGSGGSAAASSGGTSAGGVSGGAAGSDTGGSPSSGGEGGDDGGCGCRTGSPRTHGPTWAIAALLAGFGLRRRRRA